MSTWSMVAHILSSRTLTDKWKMETGELLVALKPVNLMYASQDNRDPSSNKAEVRANVQDACDHIHAPPHTHVIISKRHHEPHYQVPKEPSAELRTRFITSPLTSRQRLSGWGQWL